MTIASFFSGIGGLELGLEWAGLGPTVFQCERDPYAQRVLEKHWPGVQRHDDIATLDTADIPDAEVWCGGFPCQDISVAGKGVGLSGERSGLWYAWLDLIRVVRPRILVVENVAAFLGRGLGDVLGQLAEVGFDAEWSTLQAAEVGAPHRRDRVFVIAWRRDVADAERDALRDESRRRRGASWASAPEPRRDGEEEHVADADEVGRSRRARVFGEGRGRQPTHCRSASAEVPDAKSERCGARRPRGAAARREGSADSAGEVAPDADSGRREGERVGGLLESERSTLRNDAHGCGGEEEVGDANRARLEERQGGRRPRTKRATLEPGWWATEPDVGRVAHGVPNRAHRLRCLGNAVVPQCAYVVGMRAREILQAGEAYNGGPG